MATDVKIFKKNNMVALECATLQSFPLLPFATVVRNLTGFQFYDNLGNALFNSFAFAYTEIKDEAGAAAGASEDLVRDYLSQNLVFSLASGSGTQYTDGDAVISPIGTLALGYDGTNVRAIKTDSAGVVEVSGTIDAVVTNDPFSTDAAGRQRSSEVVNLGDYKILNSQFDTTILQQNGTATFIQNVNSITMAVTSGQFGIFTSKQYHPYFNGKSQIVQITTFGLGAATNVEKSIGYISSNAVSPFNSTLDGFRLFKSTIVKLCKSP